MDIFLARAVIVELTCEGSSYVRVLTVVHNTVRAAGRRVWRKIHVVIPTILARFMSRVGKRRPAAGDRLDGRIFIVPAAVRNVHHVIVWRHVRISGALSGGGHGIDFSAKPARQVLAVELNVMHGAVQSGKVRSRYLGVAQRAFARIEKDVWPEVVGLGRPACQDGARGRVHPADLRSRGYLRGLNGDRARLHGDRRRIVANAFQANDRPGMRILANVLSSRGSLGDGCKITAAWEVLQSGRIGVQILSGQSGLN